MKRLLLALFVVLAMVSFSFAAGTIKIGVQAPITGKFASEGQGIDNAVRLWVEQVNAKGGLLGKKIEVITCDDEGTAVKAAICARELVNKGVIAVIGSYTSTATEAAQATYFRAGVLQTSDGTSDTLVKHGYWTFFRNSSPNSAEGKFTAEFFMKFKKYKRIATISDYSTFSVDLEKAVYENTKKLGGNIVYRGKIKSGDQNFTPILTKIKSYNPDVIYFSGYYTDGGLIRAQMKQLGIKADFVGGDSNDNREFVKLAGSAAAGAYIINVPLPEYLPYDIAKKFLADYRAKYHEDPPSIWTLFNVDGLRAILHAIEVLKTTDTKKIADYLHNELKDFPGITGPITWDKNGERITSAYMAYEIQPNGDYKIVYPTK
ncbi:branched-chain amino acid ABC transporter, substrate-binding protein [Deferribacter desulfuricans SSM1]|uniref:Branched-chain amino acid ABC transporter, substrate-binding protein n=1 Tax=Deferribacter desulfuricans (strain DSM 14783 / JCM 11476 / NBRC 101012 / SSM1) TaxID=639282 RepID=D3PC11_DEFDS|nr:branched-chain amino acid ABC transporter substrate-binding protein [Deferribacter desulfuricans]BAI80134.1 branched-chain amino acid ABC transporter, substrate-binding protein [Deferribacter desulfuricans SSM1]